MTVFERFRNLNWGNFSVCLLFFSNFVEGFGIKLKLAHFCSRA